jgi:hypothetical protein
VRVRGHDLTQYHTQSHTLEVILSGGTDLTVQGIEVTITTSERRAWRGDASRCSEPDRSVSRGRWPLSRRWRGLRALIHHPILAPHYSGETVAEVADHW